MVERFVWAWQLVQGNDYFGRIRNTVPNELLAVVLKSAALHWVKKAALSKVLNAGWADDCVNSIINRFLITCIIALHSF